MQHSFFHIEKIGAPPSNPLLKESYDIVHKAIKDYNPYAIVLMLSGGDDSITALLVALALGVKIDFIVHGVTGTGLPVVRRYVHAVALKFGIPIIEANAGDAFIKYVTRKGFIGRGVSSHAIAYHILKSDPFTACISKYIRKRVRGRTILQLNGVRVEESENRADNYGDNPYRQDGSDVWVNIIHWWTKTQCLDFISDRQVDRNPVSIALNRSGECNCGTMQRQVDIHAAGVFDPEWGEWMTALRKTIAPKFGWDICEQPNKKMIAEIKSKAEQAPQFMPMCYGCKARAHQFDLFT